MEHHDLSPTRRVHAATIESTPDGLVAAFFGGTGEGQPDVMIYVAREVGGIWSTPTVVARGASSEGHTLPCWNPVLHQAHDGSLLLFYKVGPNCADWWGMLIRSTDGGRNWSTPERLPEGIWGPIRNRVLVLQDGALLCPSSTERGRWQIHFERTPDLGRTWSRTDPVADPEALDPIQPAVLDHGDGRLQALCRTRAGVVGVTWSEDFGRRWSPVVATSIPNPNSSIETARLSDGTFLLVYNPVAGRGWGPRSPLVIASSRDGEAWTERLVLEDQSGEYSYPCVLQSADGRIHVAYSWRRRAIRVVSFSRDELKADCRQRPRC